MTVEFATPDTLFHLDDPETSQAAAINLDGTATETVMHAIVTLLEERGSLAPWEMERIYFDQRGRRGWPIRHFYDLHKRASQLKRQVGVLRGTGEKVAPPTGGRSAERLGLAFDATHCHALITKHMTGGKR